MPERPIRRQALESRPVLSAGHLDWQAAFFGGLSNLALGMYDQIKKREAVEQFETARRDWQTAYNVYNQEMDKNPLQPDIGKDEEGPLPKFRKDIEKAYGDISKRLTNSAAAREFDNWAKGKLVDWKDEAISRSYEASRQMRISTANIIHDDLLRTRIIGQEATELDDLQKKVEANIVGLMNEGVLKPNEVDNFQLALREGREKLNYNWWREHLVGLPPELYKKELAKSGLDAEQIRSIESIRASIKREADAQKDEEQYENARKRFVEVFNNELTDPQVITDDLSQDKLSLPIANSLRNILLEREKPTFNLDNYIPVKEAISDLTLTKKQRLEVLAANLKGLDETTRKSLTAEIFAVSDPADPVNEPTNKDILSAITELENGGFLIRKEFKGESDRDIKIENLSSRIQLHNAYMKWVKENPMATPKQKREYFEQIVNPYKDAAAKDFLDKAWEYMKRGPFGRWPPIVGEEVQRETPLPPIGIRRGIPEESLRAAERLRQRIKGEKVEPEPAKEMKLQTAPDVAFDKIWPKLTDKEKSKILTALKNGYTAKEILEALGEK